MKTAHNSAPEPPYLIPTPPLPAGEQPYHHRWQPYIIAIDFDGTLCNDCWPEIGPPHEAIIARAKRRQAQGTKLILWTCRVGQRLDEAVEWCAARGLHFDAVNANLPEIITAYSGDSRKITADEYWDDRGVRP